MRFVQHRDVLRKEEVEQGGELYNRSVAPVTAGSKSLVGLLRKPYIKSVKMTIEQ